MNANLPPLFSVAVTLITLVLSILMLCYSWRSYQQAKQFRKDMEEMRDRIDRLVTPDIDWSNRKLVDKNGNEVVPLIEYETKFKLLNTNDSTAVAQWTNSAEFYVHGRPVDICKAWPFQWSDCEYIILDGVKLIVDRENQKLKNEDGTYYVIDPLFLK